MSETCAVVGSQVDRKSGPTRTRYCDSARGTETSTPSRAGISPRATWVSGMSRSPGVQVSPLKRVSTERRR